MDELDTIIPTLQMRKLKLRLYNFPKVTQQDAVGALQGEHVEIIEKQLSVKNREK